MKLFKPKYRVVAACGGYIPQFYHSGNWIGITKDLDSWYSPEHQRKYCLCEVETTAYTILASYKAIVE